MRNLFVACALLILASCGAKSTKSEIFAPDGVAIKGYDPVAFFKEKSVVKGTSAYVYTWKDAQWHFASKENLDDFKANPTQYAPQYGGYCAYGTSAGHKAPTETDTWEIVDGKLYFNYDKKVKESWMKDQKVLIKKADKQWPLIKDKE